MADTVQLGIRVPRKIRDAINKLAEDERRTINAQMLILIEEGLERRSKGHTKASGKD